MSKLEELLAVVQKTSARIEAVEKTVTTLGNQRSDATELIRKALTDGRGGANPVVSVKVIRSTCFISVAPSVRLAVWAGSS